jgi:predicted alpha/beta-fold hydrolase
MSDGGTVALDWASDIGNKANLRQYRKRVVILVHGILGDSQSEYLYYLSNELLQQDLDLNPVVFVARGCGGLSLTSGSMFAGKISNDLYELINYIKLRYQTADNNTEGNRPEIYLIGFSLGAASVLHYLSQMKECSGITAAVAVSPPWDFERNARFPTLLSTLWSSLISLPLKLYFLVHYRTLIQYDAERYQKKLWPILFQAITITDFDKICFDTYDVNQLDKRYLEEANKSSGNRNAIAYVKNANKYSNKYRSHLDYYRDFSPIHDSLKDISIPTLTISALDDPVCPHDHCPSGDDCDVFGPNLIVVSGSFLLPSRDCFIYSLMSVIR